MVEIIKKFANNQIIHAVIFLLFFWFVYGIRDIILGIFISYIIAVGLIPLVSFLKNKRIPNVLAVIVSYIGVLALLFLIILPLIPFFASQFQSLFKMFPRYLDQTSRILGLNLAIPDISSLIGSELDVVSKNALSVTSRLFGGLFSVVTIFVVSFYLLLDIERIRKNIVGLFPQRSQNKVYTTFKRVEEKLGAWVRGQILLSFFVGSITWIVLTIAGLEFALPLALLAGILEIVPTIGPIIAAIPAVIIALNSSLAMTIIITGIYVGIQVLENNVLVPKIMQRTVGLNPVVIILGILIGGKLFGIIGSLLSIPFISLLLVVFDSFKKGK
ncbi:AI-2E family transporter [Candidatus Parcubacteria bacterium]|nr:MAG: AI-2E family transporter [Candidatus Parcubacteria bacterium]